MVQVIVRCSIGIQTTHPAWSLGEYRMFISAISDISMRTCDVVGEWHENQIESINHEEKRLPRSWY